jgi:hypothetical protein
MGLLDDIKNTINPVTIDQFKATIGKRGGIATTNRFAITITPPNQALFNLDGLLGGGALINDPRDINILCQSCSLPGKLVMTGDYDAYGANPRKYPQSSTQEDVTFNFLLTNDFYAKKIFDKWQNSIVDQVSQLVSYDSEYKTDVFIQELDKDNTPVYAVRLRDAYPTSVNSVDLTNDNTDTTASVSVTMTYDYFETEKPMKSLINSTSDKLSIFKRLI